MGNSSRDKTKPPSARWYWGADVPKSLIRRFALAIAEQFQPEKIILFGSHAYGKPDADSDVDILVIMPCRNQIDQAVRIRQAVERQFPLDIIVRTPHNIKWRLAQGDDFLKEIVSKGNVLYEAPDGRMGEKSGGRLSRRKQTRRRKASSA